MAKEDRSCFGRAYGCEWLVGNPKCPDAKRCLAEAIRRNGKRDCKNCIVKNFFAEHLQGLDSSDVEFRELKRFLEALVEEWCAGCEAHGYGKWREDIGCR